MQTPSRFIAATARRAPFILMAMAAALFFGATSASAQVVTTWVPTTTGTYDWSQGIGGSPADFWTNDSPFNISNTPSPTTANFTAALGSGVVITGNLATASPPGGGDTLVGILNIGTTTTTGTFTLASGVAGTKLLMNENGAGAQINEISTAQGDTISAPIQTQDSESLTISNASGHTLTVSGGITTLGSVAAGTNNLIINGTGNGAITLSGGTINNSGNITVTNTGSGTYTLGVIGGTSGSVVGNISLSSVNGANTLNSTINNTGNITINANGTGADTLSGTITSTGNISATTTNTGAISISGTSSTYAASNTITLSTASATSSGGSISLAGVVAGSDNLNLSVGLASITLANATSVYGSTGTITFSGLSSTGSITLDGILDTAVTTGGNGAALTNNVSTGTGTITLGSLNIGSSSVTENSLTSAMVLNGTANAGFTGGITVKDGTLTFGNSATNALGVAGTTVNLGSATGVVGGYASLLQSVGGTSSQAANITLTSGSVGVLTIGSSVPGVTSNNFGGSPTYSGTLTLNGNTLYINPMSTPFVSNGFTTATVTLSGSVVGAGTLDIGIMPVNSGGTFGLYYPAGTVTLSGGNSGYSGTTNFYAGTLNINSTSALGTGTLVIGGGPNGTLVNIDQPANPIINNSTGAGIILSVSSPSEIWNSNFTFTGTQALNLGTGTVSLGTAATASRLISANSSTLTVGGIISNGTNGTTPTTTLIKAGAGTLVLNAAEAYTGGTIVNAGLLGIGSAGSVAANSILLNNGGSLTLNGAFTTAASALGSVSTSSTGDLAETGTADSTALVLTGYNSLMLGASSATTFTGLITPGSTGYHLGGGGSTLTLTNANALTGSNNLTIGAISVVGTPVAFLYTSTLGTSGTGTVKLTAANNMSGTTTVNAGTLDLSGASNVFGTLINSAITVNNGATLAIDSTGATGATNVNRAASVTLDGGALTDTPVVASQIMIDNITGALTLNTSANSIQVTPNGIGGSQELTASSLALGTNSFAFINGVNLGNKTPGTNANSNIVFTTAPTSLFVGSMTQTTGGNPGNQVTLNAAIIPELVGVVTATTGGTGTTGGTPNTFLTYDTTTGLRPLNLTDEFATSASLIAGTAGGDNVYISATPSGNLTAGATINSLVIGGGAATTLTITDGQTLTDSSGALLFNTSGANVTIAPSSSSGTLAFGSNPAYIDVNSTDGATTSATISAKITASGGIVKEGVGTLFLNNGLNSITGGIYILNGILNTAITTNANPYGTGTIYLGDTGGSNSTALDITDYTANTLNITFNNPIVVQGGNTGTATISATAFSSASAIYTGNITLGSANAAGAIVGHNLTIDAGSSQNTSFGLTVTGQIVDPTSLTGPAGVLNIVDDDTNDPSALVFGNLNSTYTGGTTIGFGGSLLGGPVIRFTSGTGTIFGTGTVTINGMYVSESGTGTVTGANNQIWNEDWNLTGGNLNWNLSGTIDLGNVASGTIRTIGNNSATETLSIAGAIQNGSNGTTNSFATAGAGTTILTGANIYTGQTFIDGGSLSVASINGISINHTATSNLGAPTTVTNGTISIGSGTSSGALIYTGGTFTTDRVINLSGTTGGATITNNGTGALTFTSNFTVAPMGPDLVVLGAKTLTLNGSQTAGGANIINGTIVDSGTGFATSLSESGDVWMLLGTDTYTGNTTIASGGSLQIGNGGTIGSITSSNVADAGTLLIDHSSSQNLSAVAGIVSGAGTLAQAGTGVLTINNAQTLTGTVSIIGAGTVDLNALTGSLNGVTGTALTFSGEGGTFNYDSTGSSGTTAQGMKVLTASAGENTVESTYGSGGTATLTFSSLAARTAGATLNFVTSGGTNGTTNSIVLTGAAAGFINQGEFFGGSNYAYMNATGTYVRGINYGTDTNSGFTTGGTTLASNYTGTTLASGVNVRMDGAISAQTTQSISTLNIDSASTLTLATGANTLTTSGILVDGGNAATIATASGGTGTLAIGTEGVIRTNLSTDSLNITSVVSGTALTKSGAGTLTLGGTSTAPVTNTYTGTTTLDGGTLDINSSGALGTTGNFVIHAGTTIDNTSGAAVTFGTTHNETWAGDFTFTGTNALNLGTGTVSLGANDIAARTVTVNGSGATGVLTVGGVISNGNNAIIPTTGLTKAGTGALVLTGTNTYTGTTTVSGGTLYANNATSSTGTGAVAVSNGGTFSGTGKIAPTGGNGITVANGGNLAPGGVQGGSTVNGSLTINTAGATAGDVILAASAGSGLTFALGTGSAGPTGSTTSVSQLLVTGNVANIMNFNVGGTSGTSTVVTINDLAGSALTFTSLPGAVGSVNPGVSDISEYVLIQGNDTTYNGLTLGGNTVLGQQILGGLSLLTPTVGNTFSNQFAGAELFLDGDNIVLAVPEPGTWALMLGGLGLLVFIQRRKGKLVS